MGQPATFMNPSSDTQIIYPGTIVAQVSPVQEVVNPNSKIDEEGELRTYLTSKFLSYGTGCSTD